MEANFNFEDYGYVTPSGLNFNFLIELEIPDCAYIGWIDDDDYQWVDFNEAQWNICLEGPLRQIWGDENYVYAVTADELAIIDVDSELRYAYADPWSMIDSGYTTIWGNDTEIYLGTVTSGIKYLDKSAITGDTDSPHDLLDVVFDYVDEPQHVRYLHGNDDVVLCCTTSGVEYLIGNPVTSRYKTTVSGANKCFMTTADKVYYTTSGTNWEIHRKNSVTADWGSADVVYPFDGSSLPRHVSINDIFVTEDTTASGTNNTLFVAASDGVYIIDESDSTFRHFDAVLVYDLYFPEKYDTTNSGTDFNFDRPEITKRILYGTSNNFTAIWVFQDRVFMASPAALTVMNIDTEHITEWYTPDHAGYLGEELQGNDIVDININLF